MSVSVGIPIDIAVGIPSTFAARVRALDLGHMPDRIRTRFLVVGSGVAGLHTAWRAAEHSDVLVTTKLSLFDSATAYAQGGIAASLGNMGADDWRWHMYDTVKGADWLGDQDAIEYLCRNAPTAV